jgi:hypothetical protein
MSERNLRIWLLVEHSSRALQRMMQQCGTGQRQAWEVIRKSRPHSIDCVLEIACNCRFEGVDSGRSTWSASIGDICKKKHKVTLRPREGIAHLMTAVTHSSKQIRQSDSRKTTCVSTRAFRGAGRLPAISHTRQNQHGSTHYYHENQQGNLVHLVPDRATKAIRHRHAYRVRRQQQTGPHAHGSKHPQPGKTGFRSASCT